MNKGVWDIIRANFVTSAVKAEQYPTPPLIEAAFIGRSNVGKSSLINSLCRRNGLARVSATPGKTQTINYYLLDAKRTLEDGARWRTARKPPSSTLSICPVTVLPKPAKTTRICGPALSANTCLVRIIWQWCAS